MYEADGGEGFSGGPVVDAASGDVIGITFGYRDVDGEAGSARQMYAYDMKLVMKELNRLLDTQSEAESYGE